MGGPRVISDLPLAVVGCLSFISGISLPVVQSFSTEDPPPNFLSISDILAV